MVRPPLPRQVEYGDESQKIGCQQDPAVAESFNQYLSLFLFDTIAVAACAVSYRYIVVSGSRKPAHMSFTSSSVTML